CYQYYSGYTF
nr:immunoglobulin light chain junction region [Macaca mulatta]MOV60925.1 immunoglobulin light chain junction region [Macaca mulatta]MOV60937.1 immunoglobulin light chain junction region [Macaca mulatta]MOV60950.1 immunoglobulin light chain junction region [Macaca mulatta]MOV60971.1 immunoglobulin light chain junction region [Macaca mulatta]